MALRTTGLLATILWLGAMSGCGSPSDRIGRMSDAEMLEALKQPQNEPFHVWYGMLSGSIEKNNAGWVGPQPIAIAPRSFLIRGEKIIRQRMERNPRMFLPLLAPDPRYDPLPADRVILVYYLYTNVLPGKVPLEPQAKAEVASAFRKLLGHPDVRARYVAARWLVDNEALGLADWKIMLNDQNSLLRYEAAVYSGKLSRTSEWWAILLEHLNDPHWAVRHQLAGNLYEYRNGPGMANRGLPFDWIRADWQSREEMREAWRQWHEQNAAALEPQVGFASTETASGT